MRLSSDLLLRIYFVFPGASSYITARSGNLFASETVPGKWSVHHSPVCCGYRVSQFSDIPRFRPLTIYLSSSCADVQLSARTFLSIDIVISRCQARTQLLDTRRLMVPCAKQRVTVMCSWFVTISPGSEGGCGAIISLGSLLWTSRLFLLHVEHCGRCCCTPCEDRRSWYIPCLYRIFYGHTGPPTEHPCVLPQTTPCLTLSSNCCLRRMSDCRSLYFSALVD